MNVIQSVPTTPDVLVIFLVLCGKSLVFLVLWGKSLVFFVLWGACPNFSSGNATKLRRCVVAKLRDIGYVHPALPVYIYHIYHILYRVDVAAKFESLRPFKIDN